MIVIDANVAVKWYLNELGSTEAASYLRMPVKRVAPTSFAWKFLVRLHERFKKDRQPWKKLVNGAAFGNRI